VTPQRRTARAACAVAVDLAARGEIDARAALMLVDPSELAAAWAPEIEREGASVLARGVAAGKGIARGRAAFTPRRALELGAAGLTPMLVVPEVEPEDVDALRVAAGIVVTRGGITGEAAIMARALGKPCVASSSLRRGALQVGDQVGPPNDPEMLYEGDAITVDGSSGIVARGAVVLAPGEPPPEVRGVLALVGEPTDAVIAIVSSVEDVESAKRFGARRAVVWATEEMLFDGAPAEAGAVDAGDVAGVEERLAALLRAAAGLGGRSAIRVPERAISRRGEEWNADAIRRVVGRAVDAVGNDAVEIVGEVGERRWCVAQEGAGGSESGSESERGSDSERKKRESESGRVLVILEAAALAPRLAAAMGAGVELGAVEIACPPALVPAARLALARGGSADAE
jgi:phosphohistidine swiveling domain-containing protein